MSLVSPIRSATGLRQAVWALMALFGLLNLLWFIAIAPPPPSSGFERCLTPSERSGPVCDAIRPTWMTWDHDLESWQRARACTVADDALALTRVVDVVPDKGTQHLSNLRFLAMVRAQEGSCVLEPRDERIVELEHQKLQRLEDAVWSVRVENAVASEASWISLRSRWHRFGTRFLPLWLPTLLFGWLVTLTAARRMLRYAAPLELEVGPSGVRIDGRVIERSAIAYLSIEGRRLRIERWLGPPIYSRPLPPETLSNVLEICENVGLWDEDTEPLHERHRQRVALERLLGTLGPPV